MDLHTFFARLLSTENEALIQELITCTTVHEYKKGDILIQAGEAVSKVDFLLTGIYRGYFIDSNGRDITDCFAYKTGSPLLPSTELNIPAIISIQAITAGSVVSISIDTVRNLLQKYPEVGQLYIRLLSESAQEHWKIKNAIYQYTALQRYEWFQDNYPGLVQKVSNRYIASYLNITPVTLSRIRANLRDQGKKKASGEGAATIEDSDKNKGVQLKGTTENRLW